MIRVPIMVLFILLALSACNLPFGPGGEIPPLPTIQEQPAAPPVEPTLPGLLPAPDEILPVPAGTVEIEGAAYLAYQLPGDPFRIVCQQPCALDQDYIFAEYAGFWRAHALLIALTGVDTLAELQPVDMHLELTDSICQDFPYGHANLYAGAHQAYTCSEGPGYYPSLADKIQAAALAGNQYFPLHEYLHTLFFGRLSGQAGDFYDRRAEFFHDFVVPLPSFAIGLLPAEGFCSDPYELPPGDFGGRLILELCRRNNFSLADLASSLAALDALYQSGGGQVLVAGFFHPVPAVAQYRDILNTLLGGDTTAAFAAACWPPELFGNLYLPAPGCPGSFPVGTATPIK